MDFETQTRMDRRGRRVDRLKRQLGQRHRQGPLHSPPVQGSQPPPTMVSEQTAAVPERRAKPGRPDTRVYLRALAPAGLVRRRPAGGGRLAAIPDDLLQRIVSWAGCLPREQAKIAAASPPLCGAVRAVRRRQERVAVPGRAVKDESIRQLACCFPGLRRIDLSELSLLSDVSLGALAGLRELEELDLSSSSQRSRPWSADALSRLVEALPRLAVLRLSHWWDSSQPVPVLAQCPLRTLELRSCAGIRTADDLGRVLNGRTLTELDLACCPIRDSALLNKSLRGLPFLKRVGLASVPAVTADTLVALGSASGLEALDVASVQLRDSSALQDGTVPLLALCRAGLRWADVTGWEWARRLPSSLHEHVQADVSDGPFFGLCYEQHNQHPSYLRLPFTSRSRVPLAINSASLPLAQSWSTTCTVIFDKQMFKGAGVAQGFAASLTCCLVSVIHIGQR